MADSETPKLLTRDVDFELVRAADGEGDGLTLEGYGAVFDTPTRIDSWEGRFDEQIARGAFRKSLRAQTPVLQFDHGKHPSIGSIPIGSIEQIREDARGLFVRARLHDNALIQPVRDAIASGSIHGMSFRFQVIRDEWRNAKGELMTEEQVVTALRSGDPKNIPMRTLKEVRMPELGPVVFPAYATTSVGVRSEDDTDFQVDDLDGTPNEPRDAEGASGDRGEALDEEPSVPSLTVPTVATLDVAIKALRSAS